MVLVAPGIVAAQEPNLREWQLALDAPSVSRVAKDTCPGGEGTKLSFDAALVDNGPVNKNRIRVRKGGELKTLTFGLEGGRVRVAEPRPANMTLTLCGAFPFQRIASADWMTQDGALGSPLGIEKVGLRYAVNTGVFLNEKRQPYALYVYAGRYDVTFEGEPGWLEVSGGGVSTVAASTSGEGG